jgi:hypothetical protein
MPGLDWYLPVYASPVPRMTGACHCAHPLTKMGGSHELCALAGLEL